MSTERFWQRSHPGKAVAVALILLLVGCAQKRDEKIIRMGYVSGPTELLHSASEQFADRVAERSGGKLRVRLYPSGQLGDDRETVEGLKLRSIDMTVMGCAFIGWYAPEYGMTEAPFVWRDYEHIDRVWRGEIGEELRETLREWAGLEMRHLWYRGPRYLTTTSKKIHTPEDLQGLKLRVPELEVYIKSWQTFGANTTPLPFTDMFMALKLGVVEGQENPLATIYGNNLHEVQKYVMETHHLIGFYVFCTGPHLEERFTEEERKIILEAAQYATDWHNREVERSEADYRKKLIEGGAEFVPVDREAFLKLAKEKIPPLFEGTWKPGLYRRILETP
ncbi:MAG: TRAP transporter substrate-binding protein [Planctomycetes bacterium]|nr:TRAP transporter substrate-binding protein [Planctomycetota bacterium]